MKQGYCMPEPECARPSPPRGWHDDPCGSFWKQCDSLFSASATVTGQGTATITFDVSTSNFTEFRPRALRAQAVTDTATDPVTDIFGINFTSISYAGREFLNGGDVPAALFHTDAEQGLPYMRLPDLIVSGRDLTIDISSDFDNATDTVVRLVLIGWGTRA